MPAKEIETKEPAGGSWLLRRRAQGEGHRAEGRGRTAQSKNQLAVGRKKISWCLEYITMTTPCVVCRLSWILFEKAAKLQAFSPICRLTGRYYPMSGLSYNSLNRLIDNQVSFLIRIVQSPVPEIMFAGNVIRNVRWNLNNSLVINSEILCFYCVFAWFCAFHAFNFKKSQR